MGLDLNSKVVVLMAEMLLLDPSDASIAKARDFLDDIVDFLKETDDSEWKLRILKCQFQIFRRTVPSECISTILLGLKVSGSLQDKSWHVYFESLLIEWIKSNWNSPELSQIHEAIDDPELKLLVLALKAHHSIEINLLGSYSAPSIKYCQDLASELFNQKSNESEITRLLRFYTLMLQVSYSIRMGELHAASNSIEEIQTHILPTLCNIKDSRFQWIPSEAFALYVETFRVYIQVASDPGSSLSSISTLIPKLQEERYQTLLYDVLDAKFRILMIQCRYPDALDTLTLMIRFTLNMYQKTELHLRIAQYAFCTKDSEQGMKQLICATELLKKAADDDLMWLKLWVDMIALAVSSVAPESAIDLLRPADVVLKFVQKTLQNNKKRCQTIRTCSNKEIQAQFAVAEFKFVILSGKDRVSTKQIESLKDAVLIASDAVASHSLSADSMARLGHELIVKGQYDEGHRVLTQALRLARHIRDLRLQLDVLYYVSQIDLGSTEKREMLEKKWQTKASALAEQIQKARRPQDLHDKVVNYETR